jgi:Transposase DDE domain group 1
MTITIPYLRRRPARITPRAILPDLSEQECRKLLDTPRTASGSRAWSTRPRNAPRAVLNLIRAAFRGDDAERRFYHGYYYCYCYLPLYVFCDQAADAKDEVARFIRQIRARWRRVKILAWADSGFAREELMAWCEANGVDYLFGLACNARLVSAIAEHLAVGFKQRPRAAIPQPTPVISSDVPG